MNQILTGLIVSAFLLCPANAQFGGLKKILDKADSAKQTLDEFKISEQDERAIGQGISQKIRDIYGVQQDEAQTRYVALVGLVVAAKSERPKLDYQFVILDSDSINAFAAPGGLVHITRGALAAMKNEAELAGVLAHEISHVTEKHTLNGIQKLKGIELADDQTTLRENSQVMQKIVDKATEALLQGFSRAEELEADEVGIQIAAEAGYDPQGLGDFLETLKSRYSERKTRTGLFASHPQTDERIKKVDKQIKDDKLGKDSPAILAERFAAAIQYELREFADTSEVVEGARGLAGESSGGKENKEEEEDKAESEKKEQKSGGGLLSKLRNPTGLGEKEERAEVTGSAAARGVETEFGMEDPGNPEVVSVEITPDELKKFKEG